MKNVFDFYATLKKKVVVKIGGSIIENEDALDTIIKDIKNLRGDYTFFIVQGAGQQVNRMLPKNEFIKGLRVTTEDHLPALLSAYEDGFERIKKSLHAYHIYSSKEIRGSDGLVYAKPCGKEHGLTGTPHWIDLDKLGRIEADHPIVISPEGIDAVEVKKLNVNADQTASALAQAVRADYLISITQVGGLLDYAGIPMKKAVYNNLKGSAPIKEGMIPKLSSLFDAAKNGIYCNIVGPVDTCIFKSIHGQAGTEIIYAEDL